MPKAKARMAVSERLDSFVANATLMSGTRVPWVETHGLNSIVAKATASKQ